MAAAADSRLPFQHGDADATDGDAITRALRSVRKHLGMEVAYVSEFIDNRTVFRQVDAPGLEHLIKVGDSHSLDDVYCRHILAGRLPNLMPDTAAVPLAASMPITDAVPIRKHISVPLQLDDGEVYGMFCCLGPQADPSLNERDLQTMRVFAEFTAHEIGRDIQAKRNSSAKIARISEVMSSGQMAIVYQPICDIQDGRVAGFECLTRFASTPYRTPDVWFKEASDIEQGAVLELAAIKLAVKALAVLPEDIYLGLNASPETIISPDFARVFDGLPLRRIVLEVTEHAEVKDYQVLLAAIESLRQDGVRLAVDDAGAGYSGLQHILRLRPDLIKLDLALTRNIDEDLARRALAAALVSFAAATDSEIIAEGVETASELRALNGLGVRKAQGYFLGRPSTLADALCAMEYGLPGIARAKREHIAPSDFAAPQYDRRCAVEYGTV
jgi:EAL domain-containing protein (putative c-di-GMP-specific phosphodiesterase class I)